MEHELHTDDMAVALVAARSNGEELAAPGPTQPCLTRARGVLVIEDEAVLRKTLAKGLRQRGFEVWAAEDGEAAVEVYCRLLGQIDMVLSDVRMPGLSGPEAVDALRAINPAVPFCFMTGDARLSTRTDLLKRGALRVYIKPFSVAEVAAELSVILSRLEETGRHRPSEDADDPTPDGRMPAAPGARRRPPDRVPSAFSWPFAGLAWLVRRWRGRQDGVAPPGPRAR